MLPLLSIDFRGLFPEGIVSFFTQNRRGVEVLLPLETEIAAAYGSKRLSDFCTGRYCLRSCTNILGFNGEIPIGERGMPILPPGIVGTVSHSKVLSGAVAASTNDFQSVGLDIESNGRINREMWHLLFNDNESEFLMTLSAEDQVLTATKYFSAKEAFYKMQYPISGMYLDFHDVEMLPDNGETMLLRLLSNAGPFKKGSKFELSSKVAGNEIVTFCALPK
ncbi:MAG: 4'-phosphopantetheinyl transferase superfamily protein [Chitinophagaceae bacterium]|nr:4'-phosphopantetheinyl transferase superfamily protein [Chitinophagaceae bacterium]